MLRSVRQLLWAVADRSHSSRRARRRQRFTLAAAEVGLWSAELLEDRTLLTYPEFDQASYFFDVSEAAAAGGIGNIVATDPDHPGGPAPTYSGGGGPFSVDPDTGEVSFTGSLDYEAQAWFSFTVVATDSDSETSPVTVDVYLTDVDDTAPAFVVGSATAVSEDAQPGDWVDTLYALDPDTNGAALTYSIVSDPNEPAPPFGIGFSDGFDDDGTGSFNSYADLVVSGALDYETQSSYTFTVKVEDPDGRSSTIEVTVGVSDVDDRPPVFSPDLYSATIAEDAAGTAVAAVQATDPDTDPQNLSYSISGGNDDGQGDCMLSHCPVRTFSK